MSKPEPGKGKARQPGIGGPPQSQIKRVDSNRSAQRAAPSPLNLRQPQSRASLWVVGGVVVLLVLIVGGIFVSIFPPGSTYKGPSIGAGKTGDSGSPGNDIGEGIVAFPSPEQGHQDSTISYKQNPPIGGIHNPRWQNCGVYDQPVGNENAIHSLEHGAVWITYRPDQSAAEVNTLRGITQQSGYRLLSPYPGLSSPVVASAWGYQLKLDKADDPRLMRFIQKYEQNSKGPEPGASCSGGAGQPISLATWVRTFLLAQVNLQGTVMWWVTQKGVRLDRAACAWLVLRHIDPAAKFAYLDEQGIAAAIIDGALPFHNTNTELPDVERSSFSQLLAEYKLDTNPALALMADIVNGAELNAPDAPAPSVGLKAIVQGINALAMNDDDMVERTLPVFDALYAGLTQLR